MLYDSHTHLNDDKLYPERRTYLGNFIAQWWKGLVNIGIDEEHNRRAIEIAEIVERESLHCQVRATVGYHPSEVCFGTITEKNIDEKMQALRTLIAGNEWRIVWIGECGIDTHYDGEKNIPLQQELFRRQCELAREMKLPIVIHSRDDFPSTLEVIKNFPDDKIYFHCYWYTAEEIKVLQQTFAKLWIGFCGNVTYPKAQSLRDALLTCEKGNVVLETDAPYLAPQPVRGTVNEPANVKYIYTCVAELWWISFEEVCNQIEINVGNLYTRK